MECHGVYVPYLDWFYVYEYFLKVYRNIAYDILSLSKEQVPAEHMYHVLEGPSPETEQQTKVCLHCNAYTHIMYTCVHMRIFRSIMLHFIP